MMKTSTEINNRSLPQMRVDSTLDKYDSIVLFPEKLKKVNDRLKKTGFPKLPNKKDVR